MGKLITGSLLILLFFSACGNWEDKRKLAQLQDLAIEYPDSALFLLDVATHPRLMNDKNLSEWCLLNASLHERLDKDMDIDTVFLNRTILYYKSNKKLAEAAKAAIYLSKALVYYGDYNRAVNVCLEAMRRLDRTENDGLKGDVRHHLADLYHKEGNYEKAAKFYLDASRYYYDAGNMSAYGISLREVAKDYLRQNKSEDVLALCLRIDSLARRLNDSTLMSFVADYSGIVYMKKRKYDVAENFFLRSVRLDSINNPHVYLSLSRLYALLGEKEKASFFLNRFKTNKDLHALSSYWWQKYELCKHENNVNAALRALERYVNYQDTIWKTADNLYVTELVKKYNYSQMEDENVILSRRFRRGMFGISFLSILLILLYMRYKQKSDRVKSKELELKIEGMKRAENEKEIKRKEKELELLKKNEVLMKQNLLKRSLMFTKIRMLSELRLNNPQAFLEETGKILSATTLSEEDWKGIKEEMNFAFPGFTERLSNQIPKLTEEEIRFCCLLKAGLDTAALATLLNINTTSVDRRRARINKKIREVYPTASWQDFIDFS